MKKQVLQRKTCNLQELWGYYQIEWGKFPMRKSGACSIRCHMKQFFFSKVSTLITNSILSCFAVSVIIKNEFSKYVLLFNLRKEQKSEISAGEPVFLHGLCSTSTCLRCFIIHHRAFKENAVTCFLLLKGHEIY